ncbi:MAG: lipase maturation factor family protein [Candidatus Omnitrophica bacterium]|nr:lipase maturation factor family protein [Candidatus Omnitrophota bacterium]
MIIKVVNPPSLKPLMLYDGDCHFCSRWIMRWKRITGGRIDYTTSQESGSGFPEIPEAMFADAVCLITTDGDAVFGAEAVYRSLALGGSGFFRFAFQLYKRFFLFKWISDIGYGAVARHRMFFSSLEKKLTGVEPPETHYNKSASVFRIFTAAIFFFAFVSAGTQIIGLVGENGIYPVSQVVRQILSRGSLSEAWHSFPSLTLIDASDSMIMAHCAVGAAAALMVALGVLQSAGFLLLWLLYLSLSVAGTIFFSFQWDTLLLECGFLSVFISPLRLKIGTHRDYAPPGWGVWLFRWLLFRLIFASGFLKLTAGGEEWSSLTAMTYHYFTQPLPSAAAWFFHQLPVWFHALTTAVVLFCETILPFFLFFGKRAERLALAGISALMIMIALTGSYGFFNLLTLAICVLLWGKSAPQPSVEGCGIYPDLKVSRKKILSGAGQMVLFCILFTLSSAVLLNQVTRSKVAFKPLNKIITAIQPFRIINSYGLFINMTTQRDEIIIEGSDDLREWKEYEFHFKPGKTDHAPLWNIPHQPRVDWQMWFASLGDIKTNRWFSIFLSRLLENQPPVTRLLKVNPFESAPPKFIRAVRYRYRFSSWSDLMKNGSWWLRSRESAYSPIISAESGPVALKKSAR